MGPRPRGRGIGGTAKALAEFNHLQWGRDRAVAELGAKGAQGLAAAQPSMGPRPRGRGIAKSPEAARLPSFLQWGRDRAVAEFRQSRRNISRLLPLQWGRDRAVAEFPPRRRPAAHSKGLQWGRDRAVAEFRQSRRNISRLLPLQWGRDRAVAELLAAGIPWRAPSTFNGAATARSRNFSAEHLHGRGDFPSMGPRPRGRGIAASLVWDRFGDVPLQWGRDRAVAELPWSRLASCCRATFNGAATARSRNSETCAADTAGLCGPSMGPRPRGRGIAMKAKNPNLGELPSMGPRPRGRGIASARRRTASAISPFNGAATARSRN